MGESSFASLGPTLLARKGGAKPAMRPQHVVMPGMGAGMATGLADPATEANLEDLGWNDMGEDAPEREAKVLNLTPATLDDGDDADAHPQTGERPAVHEQREAIERELVERNAHPACEAETDARTQAMGAAHEEETVPAREPRARRSARSQGRRAAFTLRLDEERHLRLRLASTVQGRSAQAIVTEALDALLADLPAIAELAAKVKSPD